MQLLDHPIGNYRFFTGIAPYSAGVVALPGYEVVRVTFQQAVPYRQGFELIANHLAVAGRPRQALCAIELRLPAPRSFTGFIDFNRDYRAILASWDILVGEHNPVARTNIAPAFAPPAEPSMYAFSYTIPSQTALPTFIVAGAGDLNDQANLTPDAVVRPGETSANALQEKAAMVMSVMEERLSGLQMTWDAVTAVTVYTIYPVRPLLVNGILRKIGPAAAHGVHWFDSHPPIADLAFEMDVRGIRQELRI